MRKITPLFLGLISLALTFGACRDDRRAYPANPQNGQVYVDRNGNNSVWNAALGYWMISSMMNGHQVNHYYYPASGQYRNANGAVIARPSHIPTYRTATSSRSSMSKSTSPSSSPAKSGGFGSTGKASSAS
jgi:hypothetical protein